MLPEVIQRGHARLSAEGEDSLKADLPEDEPIRDLLSPLEQRNRRTTAPQKPNRQAPLQDLGLPNRVHYVGAKRSRGDFQGVEASAEIVLRVHDPAV